MMSGKRKSDLSVHLRNCAIKWMKAPYSFRAKSVTGYQTRKGAKRSGHTMKLKQGNNKAKSLHQRFRTDSSDRRHRLIHTLNVPTKSSTKILLLYRE